MEDKEIKKIKQSPTKVLIGMVLTWLCAWMVPELSTMTTLYRLGHGLNRWELYISVLPGLVLLAIFLNHMVYYAGVQGESEQGTDIFGNKVKRYFLSAGRGLPVALMISVVFMIGRLLSFAMLGTVPGSQGIAIGILLVEVVATDGLLIWLMQLHFGKIKGVIWKAPVLFLTLLAAYAGVGMLISWADGFTIFAGKPMYRLCTRMLAALLDAGITTPVLLWLTKGLAGRASIESTEEAELQKEEPQETELQKEEPQETELQKEEPQGAENEEIENEEPENKILENKDDESRGIEFRKDEQEVGESGEDASWDEQDQEANAKEDAAEKTAEEEKAGEKNSGDKKAGEKDSGDKKAGDKKSAPWKKVAITYAAAVGMLAVVSTTGLIVLGRVHYLDKLSHEVKNHYANMRIYCTLGDLNHSLVENDKLKAELLLWESTLYSGAESKRLHDEAVELAADDEYVKLLVALTADRPIQSLENMLYEKASPDLDVSMALLQLYAREAMLTERQENLKKELLLYLAGNGNYLDETEIPDHVYERISTEKVEKKLDALREYDVDLSAWRYMVKIMKKCDAMGQYDKMNAIKTYFSDYHDPDSVLCLLSEQYFLDLFQNMDWEGMSASGINENYLKLAEEYPDMMALQYLAAQSFLQRTADGYSKDFVERHVMAAERYFKLYEKTYGEFQSDPEGYQEYRDMIHATQGVNGLEDAKLEFDEAGLADAKYFLGMLYYKAGMYNDKYYDLALATFGDAADFETRNLIACTYFDRKDYKTCLTEIDKMLSEMTLSDKQKGQLYYLRAMANLPLKDMEASLRDGALLAQLVEGSEGDTLLELEWLLFGYSQQLADGGESSSEWNPRNLRPADFTDKEWSILSGNKYLLAFYQIMYGFHNSFFGVQNADGSLMLGEDGKQVNGWSFAMTQAEGILKVNPNLSTIWYVCGGIWHARGADSNREKAESSETCYENAIACFEKALEIDGENGKIWYVLASTYRDMAFDLSPSDKIANLKKAYDADLKALNYMGENATHALDPYGSVIHAERLLVECEQYVGKDN